MARKLKSKAINPDLSGIGAYITIPSGSTAQRPVSPTNGMIRYNTDLGNLEQYTASGWGSIAPPPAVSSVSPSTYNGEQGTLFTINGTGFGVDAIVKFVTAQGIEYTAGSVSRISAAQLTATTPQDFTVANEPLAIKIIQGSGSVMTSGLIDCGGVPSWNTNAGTLTTIDDEYGTYTSIATLSAGDPDTNATVSYSITSGSLPGNVSLNSSNGVISGNPNNITSQTTYNFTAAATDNAGNQTARTFAIIVNPALDGSSANRAATSASAIKAMTGTSTDGTYWIKSPSGTNTAFQTYCIMSRDGGGWMKAAQYYNATSLATTSAVNAGGTWINAESNAAAGKIATADWTALNTTNSFLFKAKGIAHRYWRYRGGGAITGHHPRCARIGLTDINGTNTNIVTFTGDNCSDSGTIPGDGTSYTYDFGSPTVINSAYYYVSYGGGTRAAYSYIDWSDDNVNWTNAYTCTSSSTSCGIVYVSGAGDNLLNRGLATGKLSYNGALTAFGTDLDPTAGYRLSLDMNSVGTYDYKCDYTNDAQARCNHTTNYWISDHNYNGTFSGSAPPNSAGSPICWTIGSDRVVTNLHWLSGLSTQSGPSINWGLTTVNAFSIFIK